MLESNGLNVKRGLPLVDDDACTTRVERYHVTVLSNFARGYDRYTGRYSKDAIPESTYPDRFFLLGREELHVGIEKADRLRARLNLAGDRLIVLETAVEASELCPNTRTGLGAYVDRAFIELKAVHTLLPTGELEPFLVEDAMAHGLRVLHPRGVPWDQMRPRSVSILPIARGCQARCAFCFSNASVSADQRTDRVTLERVRHVLAEARARGAERAVVTGGGEPLLLPEPRVLELIRVVRSHFEKVVLITNGHVLAEMGEADRGEALRRLHDEGLGVLAISRHHPDAARNAELMRLRTEADRVAATIVAHAAALPRLSLRWICVLQRGGVEDAAGLERYLDWASESGASDVCFKELYVSSSVESVYYDLEANRWSRAQHVGLALVLDAAERYGWREIARLPWGAPIFEVAWRGRRLRVAAYTEPSTGWELAHGTCRSWNLMADGRCLASLEDRGSEVVAP